MPDNKNRPEKQSAKRDMFQRQHDLLMQKASNPSRLPEVLAQLGLDTDPSKQNTARAREPLSQQERLKMLRDRNWTVRIRALADLPEGQESIELLLYTFQDAHEAVRAEVVHCLSQQKRAPALYIFQALHDPSWQVREAALLACMVANLNVPETDLARSLHDPSQPVREAAQKIVDKLPDATILAGTFADPEKTVSSGLPSSPHTLLHTHAGRRSRGLTHRSFPFEQHRRRRRFVPLAISLVAVLLLVFGNIAFLAFFVSHSQQIAISNTSTPTSTTQFYQEPIVITKGGTYTGYWQSLDPEIATVTIATEDPVIIDHASIRGKGNLIETRVEHANVIVRNSYGYGLNPDVVGKTQGYFIDAWHVNNLLVENNTFVGTLGVKLDAYAGPNDGLHTVKVLRNRARDINGRASNGKGGYLTGKVLGKDWDYAFFFEAWNSPAVVGVEVAWNEVINDPGNSRVLEIIDFNRSGGTQQSPALIHDNYIQGSYPIDFTDPHTGGGIAVGHDCNSCPVIDYGFTRVYRNQIVSANAAGLTIIGGHNNEMFENRVVSAGVLADGTRLLGGIGAVIWNESHQDSKRFYNNTIHDNTIGVMRYLSQQDSVGGRCDGWWPEAGQGETWCVSGRYNNSILPNPISLQTEQDEYTRWQQKQAQAGIKVGDGT